MADGKFVPVKFEIAENKKIEVGGFVWSKDGYKSGYKLGERTACSSYHNNKSAGSCRNKCTEAGNCPIWRRTRA